VGADALQPMSLFLPVPPLLVAGVAALLPLKFVLFGV
jgi:hypothetical protein